MNQIIIRAVFFSLFGWCAKDKGPTEFSSSGNPVSFSQDIQALVEAHCSGCHNEFPAANDEILAQHKRLSEEVNGLFNSM